MGTPLWYAPDGVEPRGQPDFQRPNWWEHVGREATDMAAGCGLTEMSTYAKFRIAGPDAAAFLDRAVSARLPDRPGKAALALLLNERGGIVGDLVVDNRGDGGFYLVGATLGAGIFGRWLDRLSEGFDVRIDNVTDSVAAIGIAGPNSRALLNALSDGAFDDFPFMRSKWVEVGRTACRALRISWSGELGWELHWRDAGPEGAVRVADGLRGRLRPRACRKQGHGHAAAREGLSKLGLGAYRRDHSRAAGLERFCSVRKDYVGRAAVDAERERPPKRRFVTLEVDAAAPPCWGTEPIFRDDEPIGYVTSGGMGWRTGKMLAVGWTDSDATRPGDRLLVQVLLRKYEAIVVPDPVYDPRTSFSGAEAWRTCLPMCPSWSSAAGSWDARRSTISPRTACRTQS